MKYKIRNEFYNDGEIEDEENKNKKFIVVNFILIFFILVSFLINLMIILIHSKQKALRKGFFMIIFVQIIMESIINLSILIMNIIYICDFNRNEWFLIFPALFAGFILRIPFKNPEITLIPLTKLTTAILITTKETTALK